MYKRQVLALVMLATLPFITLLVYSKATKGIPMFTKVQRAQDRMISVVRENAQGIRVIKALSKADHEKKRYETVNMGLANEELKANTRMAAINPLMNLFMNLGPVSYTHLDVYKRQVQHRAFKKIDIMRKSRRKHKALVRIQAAEGQLFRLPQGDHNPPLFYNVKLPLPMMDVAGLPSTLVCAQRQNITASRFPGQTKPQLAVIHLMMHRLEMCIRDSMNSPSPSTPSRPAGKFRTIRKPIFMANFVAERGLRFSGSPPAMKRMKLWRQP